MDNPIVIGLLIVAGVIYKIYESFKEEQAKAKVRMEKLKKQNPIQNTIEKHPHRPIQQQPMEINKPTTFTKEERIQREYSDAIERYNRKKVEDKNRREKLKTTIKPELEILEEGVSFDLREAIIQQAILNRPYA
ncbi:MAG: hypothetical protein ACRDE7_11150 [Sphingobacterium sp.]